MKLVKTRLFEGHFLMKGSIGREVIDVIFVADDVEEALAMCHIYTKENSLVKEIIGVVEYRGGYVWVQST